MRPNIFTTFAPALTPDRASSILSSIFWEYEKLTPGNAARLAVDFREQALLGHPPGPLRWGLRSTENSTAKKLVVSVPSSGRPSCETTVVTSGKDRNTWRI